jgi:hypothetical protein
LEKAKSRSNGLSFKVFEGIGDKIVSQQPHHAEHKELIYEGTFFGVEPEWDLIRQGFGVLLHGQSLVRTSGSFL